MLFFFLFTITPSRWCTRPALQPDILGPCQIQAHSIPLQCPSQVKKKFKFF